MGRPKRDWRKHMGIWAASNAGGKRREARLRRGMVIARPAARVARKLFRWVERDLLPDYELRYSPVFILGPPRSGTTLIYQAMVHCFPVSYVTNFTETFGLQHCPIVAAKLAQLLNLTEHRGHEFESYYGRTQGMGGPHEGGGLWNRWFPASTHYTGRGHLTLDQRRAVYQVVAGVERAFDAPFVSKNVKHSVRIQALVEIFPAALFIQSRRSPLAVAQSILLAREGPFSDRRWIGVMPRNIQQIMGKDVLDEVCEQVYYTEQDIAADRDAVGSDRFLTVCYERFCKEPNAHMERIAGFMNRRGAPVGLTRRLPTVFTVSTVDEVRQWQVARLRRRLAELYGANLVQYDLVSNEV